MLLVATSDEILEISGLLISRVISSPFSLILKALLSLTNSMSVVLNKDKSSTSLSRFKECLFTSRAIVLYMAPVSRYIRARFFATDFATVLLPTPEGPSIVIMRLFSIFRFLGF